MNYKFRKKFRQGKILLLSALITNGRFIGGICLLSCLLIWFLEHTQLAQGLLLSLYSQITLGGVWRSKGDAGDHLQVGHVEGKCSTHCTLSPASLLLCFYVAFVIKESLKYVCMYTVLLSMGYSL